MREESLRALFASSWQHTAYLWIREKKNKRERERKKRKRESYKGPSITVTFKLGFKGPVSRRNGLTLLLFWIKDLDVLQCTIPYTVHINSSSDNTTTVTFSGYIQSPHTWSLQSCFLLLPSVAKLLEQKTKNILKKIYLSMAIQSDLRAMS